MVKKMKFVDFLLYMWQLPQNIAGMFCSIKAKKIEDAGYTYYVKNNFYNSGVSLGKYIIFDKKVVGANWNFAQSVLHETGHQKQSKMLGWFYLLIIGLPSLCGNIYSRIKRKSNKWYYSQPWEKWADKLGGVPSRW